MKLAKAVTTVQHYLQMQLRNAMKLWKDASDRRVNEHRFRVRNHRLLLQRQRVIVLINLKVNNRLALLRYVARSFSKWKL